MNQTHETPAADSARQAAYRRLALTILALDVPTLSVRLQASRLTLRGLPEQPQMPRAA